MQPFTDLPLDLAPPSKASRIAVAIFSSAAFVITEHSLHNDLCHCIFILLIQLCIVLVVDKTDFHQNGRPVYIVKEV